jgi:hypothetical protein
MRGIAGAAPTAVDMLVLLCRHFVAGLSNRRATCSCFWVLAAVQPWVMGVVSCSCRVLASGHNVLCVRRLLPLFLLTRLETRTKESNLYASSRALFETRMRNECEGLSLEG